MEASETRGGRLLIYSKLSGVLALLIFLGLALYWVPIQSKGFYFDDKFSIENNAAIKSIDIPKIFNTFNSRFLVGLSFAFNYQCSALHPAGYRVVNVLIHCLNAFLVFLLIRSTLSLYGTPRSTPVGSFEWPALFGAILFLCHPIQTEPVNFITQRFVLMGTFFYLLTLFLYIQYRVQSKKRYLIAAMSAALAAMFCKEFVVTLPLMLALYEFYFLESINEMIGKRAKHLIPFFVIALIVPLLLFRTPPQAIGVANIANSKVSDHIDITRANKAIDRKQYFLTELNVVCTYVRLLIVPVEQNFDYDYPITHQMDKEAVLSGAFLFCLLFLAVLTYQSYRIISFSILWFFIALSVESSVIPIGHVIAEYRVYLAGVGFVFLITSLIYITPGDRKRFNMIAVAILIGCAILTYQRNLVWGDEITLLSDTIQKSPHKARPYNNRGFEYLKQGHFAQAITDFNKAIELNPKYADAYNNRGIYYARQGDMPRAIADFTQVIRLNPKEVKAYHNLSIVYDKLKQANPSLINALKNTSQ